MTNIYENMLPMQPIVMKNSIFCDITLLVRWNLTDVSEQHISSILGSKVKLGKKPSWAGCQHSRFLLSLLLDPEDGGNMFLRKVGWLSPDYTALYPTRWNSSVPPRRHWQHDVSSRLEKIISRGNSSYAAAKDVRFKSHAGLFRDFR
jgi:hypothetical protein